MTKFLFNVFFIAFCLQIFHSLPTNVSVSTTVSSRITNATLPGFFQARTTMIVYCGIYFSNCGKNGQCDSKSRTCNCSRGYTTRTYREPCAYRQKSSVTAGCLSFFLGIIGADWYYLSDGNIGYVVAGIFKMATLGGVGIWWLVDWIRVAAGVFPDGYGVSLG